MAKDATATDQTAAIIAAAAAKDVRSAELKAKRDTLREERSGETKADAFKRIAVRRTSNVLDQLGSMRGLANKGNYDYSAEQTGKVIAAIRAAVDKLEADFKNGGPQRNDVALEL